MYRWTQPLIYACVYFGCAKICSSACQQLPRNGGSRTRDTGRQAALSLPAEIRSELHHIPKGAPYFSECLTNGFSDFSLDWLSGCQQEEDSFYHFDAATAVALNAPFGNSVNVKMVFGKLYPSGLTWEDTTASERQESNLLGGYSPVSPVKTAPIQESRLPCSKVSYYPRPPLREDPQFPTFRNGPFIQRSPDRIFPP